MNTQYTYRIPRMFLKQIKAYKKKFPSVSTGVMTSLDAFDPRNAAKLKGNNYKIRFSLPELSKGKSGGFRLIVHLKEHKGILVPFALYFKSDRANITTHTLTSLYQEAVEEFRSDLQ